MSEARSEALAALSRFLVTDGSVGDVLQRVAEIALTAMPSAAIAGISMLDRSGRPTTAIYTDAESLEIDEAQYSSGRGPCLDAWRTKAVVRIEDTTAAGPSATYPEFTAAAHQHGVLSTLSLPLVVADDGLGALNLFARTAEGFSAADEAIGIELATTASIVLANASAYGAAVDLSDQLSEAMKSRAVIEQAKGMLMALTPALDADGAFDLLRRASQRENMKLRDIAQRIVDRRTAEADPASRPDELQHS